MLTKHMVSESLRSNSNAKDFPEKMKKVPMTGSLWFPYLCSNI